MSRAPAPTPDSASPDWTLGELTLLRAEGEVSDDELFATYPFSELDDDSRDVLLDLLHTGGIDNMDDLGPAAIVEYVEVADTGFESLSEWVEAQQSDRSGSGVEPDDIRGLDGLADEVWLMPRRHDPAHYRVMRR